MAMKKISKVDDNFPGKNESALVDLKDAVAKIKASASDKDGMTPQQERAIMKIESAVRMLSSTQTKRPPTKV